MLLQRPLHHLEATCCNEEEGGKSLGCQAKQQPTPDLKKVIGAGDVIEGKTLGDLVLLGAARTQVCQDLVTPAGGQSCLTAAALSKLAAELQAMRETEGQAEQGQSQASAAQLKSQADAKLQAKRLCQKSQGKASVLPPSGQL